MTYFDEGIFGWLELKRDIYHHFKSDGEQVKVRKARKLGGGSNGELMANRLTKVSFIYFYTLFLTCNMLLTHLFVVGLVIGQRRRVVAQHV